MWKQGILLLLFLTFAVGLFAQPKPDRAQFERIREAREAFISERLLLSPAEAKAFFPVFWKYDSAMRTKRKEIIGRRQQHLNAASSALSEEEALKLLMARRRHRQEVLKLQLEAEDEFLRVLPAAKVARLESAEKAFREQLWEKTRQRRGSRHGG
ncbi:MAG: hypothetical protein AAGF89_01035 [Bacteroidota bacterium]